MDDKLLLRLERCGRCLHLFAICRCWYRGQTYCGDDCRVPARAEQKSAARATYQGTPEGREDHRDRNRELRKCAAPRVMDQGSEILVPSSSVWLPKGPLSPMDGAVEANGGSHDDDPTDCNPRLPPLRLASRGATLQHHQPPPRAAFYDHLDQPRVQAMGHHVPGRRVCRRARRPVCSALPPCRDPRRVLARQASTRYRSPRPATKPVTPQAELIT